MPKLTVVTSTYNRPQLLKRAMESVLNQTFTDFEYWIINNGSTDNTDEIIKNYMKEDSRIKLITRQSNTFHGPFQKLGSVIC